MVHQKKLTEESEAKGSIDKLKEKSSSIKGAQSTEGMGLDFGGASFGE